MYVTRRGDHPKGNLSKYKNGKVRQIKLSEVAQYLAAYEGKPVLAYKDKALIYSTHHDEVFPHDIRVEEVLFAWVCSRIVLEIVNSHRQKGSEDDRKILTKGGHFFVMGVLGHIARQRNGSIFLKSMNEEQISSKAGMIRLQQYAKYSLLTYLSCEKTSAKTLNKTCPH